MTSFFKVLSTASLVSSTAGSMLAVASGAKEDGALEGLLAGKAVPVQAVIANAVAASTDKPATRILLAAAVAATPRSGNVPLLIT
ncbi:hypothetical protein IRJ34_12045 [Paenarthrobacter sp. GOM3]|uniref:hypothetical protein n=1 Tax=Paenarthrobacter sp. GOM3 TaxID=2782567 RepID=UPI001BAC5F7D|nr:hypothetical protein [Paenarthrobacter sp. GOM3]WOH17099.1 hypothetical protein IRJ34_12045 [Paenarthrobacter sp. GOM3]